MKKLHLIRHAKSSWKAGSLADIDRPLNSRGIKSCPVMAEQIMKAGCRFEHVFCSPAVRAQTTIEQISQHINDGRKREIHWQVDQALYTFEAHALLRWCHALDDALEEVVIVGHNNAITDFVNDIGDHHIENVPTCGYVQLTFEHQTWQALSTGSGAITSFLKPKMFL